MATGQLLFKIKTPNAKKKLFRWFSTGIPLQELSLF
jgi:hypothetical protein